MELTVLLKSIIDQDTSPVVICDTEHKIVYMNSVACKRYERFGGEKLLGKSLLDCHGAKSNELIIKVVEWFKESKDNNIIHTFYSDKENKDVYMVALRDEEDKLIGYYEKHEYRDRDAEDFYTF